MTKIAQVTGKLPAALQEKPVADQYLQYYIDAFLILSRTRTPDSPISLTDIFLYADSIKEDRIEFAEIIVAGDSAWAEAKKEKAELNDRSEKSS